MPFYAVIGDTVRAVAISEETSKHQVNNTIFRKDVLKIAHLLQQSIIFKAH